MIKGQLFFYLNRLFGVVTWLINQISKH